MAIAPWPAARWTRSFPAWSRPLTACWRARWSSKPSVLKIKRPDISPASFFSSRSAASYPHGHDDVAVLVFAVTGFIRTQLPGRLGVLELEAHIARANHLQKFQEILRVESDHHGIAGVGGFQRIF